MKWLVAALSCLCFIFGVPALSFTGPPPNQPPVMSSFAADPRAGTAPVEVNLICTAHDPDGWIRGYTVEYGDGSDSETNNTGNFNHTYSHAGTYETKCTAEDNEGEAVTANAVGVHVTVGNIVIIDIDGCRADTLYDLLVEDDTNGDGKCDKLPFIGEIMGVTYNADHTFKELSNAVKIENAKTIFPTITLAAQASLYTGCYPDKHGVFGNTWFNRESETYRNYTSWPEVLKTYQDNGIANQDLQVPTIHDKAVENGLRTVVSYQQYFHQDYDLYIANKDDWVTPDLYKQFTFLIKGFLFDVFATADTNSRITEIGEMPDLLTIYYGGFDHDTHVNGVEYQKENIDLYDHLLKLLFRGEGSLSSNEIGALKRAYRRSYLELRRRSKNGLPQSISSHLTEEMLSRYQGLPYDPEKTLFVFVSDHGHTNVEPDGKHNISRRELAWIVELTGRFKDEQDAYICNNGGMSAIYLQNKSTGSWLEAPEPTDVKLVSAYLGFFEILLGDYIANRPYNASMVNMILIRSESGSQSAYSVYNPNGDPIPMEQFFDEEESQRINRFCSDNSGDIILLANYTDDVPGYGFDNKYLSTHGNITPGDSNIPLIMGGIPLRSQPVIQSASIVDLAPTLAALLGFSLGDHIDGKNLLR